MTPPNPTPNHYTLLNVKPTASPQEIRRAYRDMSKLYHPDTTTLPPAIATEKFKYLNDAYATLSNPEKRTAYDYSIGISRVAVVQVPTYLNRPASERGKYPKDNAYLDPNDRPLSPGELFALFILGLTFVGCLLLVVTVGWSKGELVLYSPDDSTAESITLPAPETTSPPVSIEQSPAVDPSSTSPRPLPPMELSPKII
ncbi:J domain-containing protein [Leptolyngbya iicbica]|uniref:J domain-containing protein n=2 Tax=Cyanophyceae TaxID=3028117 RepID=A0A4Q7E3M3_9CYAN|nr:J domain-containing protein [Leptolyngbya sp. LK]RZM77276.1 J domain-containing protein [Leptolyngbya sp. LK]